MLIRIYKTFFSIFTVIIFICLYPVSADQWDDISCEDCHDDIILDISVHEDLDCESCHENIVEIGMEHAEDDIIELSGVCKSCGLCHDIVYDEYLESVHGMSIIKPESEKEAAHCFSCHGGHNILPGDDLGSDVHPQNLAQTCGNCHAKPELVDKYNIPDLHPVELFSKSYHARQLLESADLMAATCNDCHGIHNIKKSTDPTSTISHANIAKTCGTCHEEIFEEYSNSVHWIALTRGERESPTCVDCHGEHEILLPTDPESPVSKRSAAERTCARCHTNESLIKKYGLTAGKVSSYQDSYHGLAVLKGDLDAATCYDCHNAHEILHSADEMSSVHPSNLKQTCAKCHAGATDKFAISYTHQSVMIAERPVEYYVKIIYIVLITVTIGGMLVHNGIIVIHHMTGKFKHEKSSDYIQRYSHSEVWQHLVLIISFFTLVITGFALKFTDAFWVVGLSKLGMTEPLRGLIHRIAAVVFIALSIWHLVEMIVTHRGRDFFRALLPGKADLTGFVQNIKYHLHIRNDKPRFDRFDYTEKVEYWALIWGTIIMLVSGFILWFPTFFGQFSPPWLIKVAEAFHYYEAWLATLSIFVWHFFFVLFHPSDYPMSMTWLHGRMSIEEYEHKHPEDLKNIMGEIEDYKKGNKNIDDLCFQTKEYVKRHKISHDK